MESSTEISLNEARKQFENCNISTGLEILKDIRSADLENNELKFAIRCANYWRPKFLEVEQFDIDFAKAEFLVGSWLEFLEFIGENHYSRIIDSFCRGVFRKALDYYGTQRDSGDPSFKAEVLRKSGLCFKMLGDYENALALLNDANVLLPGSSSILAEMADCYSLCGEDQFAKIFFREAFFVNPGLVDIAFLQSDLINKLIERVKQDGFEDLVLKEWIPVYGVIYGLFNIKRELKSVETGKLKQAIFGMECELKEPGCDPQVLTPRLLNNYFWLIDHLAMTNDDKTKINEILLKIKQLSPEVYAKYVV
ncbi:MAG: hypothetical protein MJ183_02700 [Treponemataceae bacterium]|nr:hypothetical protein [Treponemataceae bacterium]